MYKTCVCVYIYIYIYIYIYKTYGKYFSIWFLKPMKYLKECRDKECMEVFLRRHTEDVDVKSGFF
jgi:hypothetical protein